MNLVVSVAPYADGFRASTGTPLDLTADGPTADAAMNALRELIAGRSPAGESRAMTVADYHAFLAASAELGQSEEFDGWKEAVAEYRRVHNAVPDAGE